MGMSNDKAFTLSDKELIVFNHALMPFYYRKATIIALSTI
jgi:hypothetical protein